MARKIELIGGPCDGEEIVLLGFSIPSVLFVGFGQKHQHEPYNYCKEFEYKSRSGDDRIEEYEYEFSGNVRLNDP